MQERDPAAEFIEQKHRLSSAGSPADKKSIYAEILRGLNGAPAELEETMENFLREEFRVMMHDYHDSYGKMISDFNTTFPKESRAGKFVRSVSSIFEDLVREMHRRILRSASQSYLKDGTTAACPKCGSANVTSSPAEFEFTAMSCADCRFHETADDWQLESWYPEKG